MPSFGRSSRAQLETCHPDLVYVFETVVQEVDCKVLEGHRGEERQNQAFESGKSKVRWPNGKHNSKPSRAVDVAPWPIDWHDRERFHLFAGYVLGVARVLEVQLRWGGDWNGDWQVRDNSFDDLVHFELRS